MMWLIVILGVVIVCCNIINVFIDSKFNWIIDIDFNNLLDYLNDDEEKIRSMFMIKMYI